MYNYIYSVIPECDLGEFISAIDTHTFVSVQYAQTLLE